jgi:hypothetical protein
MPLHVKGIQYNRNAAKCNGPTKDNATHFRIDGVKVDLTELMYTIDWLKVLFQH